MNTLLERLAQARFYGILDLAYVGKRDPVAMTEELLQGGVEIVQLRGKNMAVEQLRTIAERIRGPIAEAGALFIINDHAALAAEVDADGVHIGQDDGPVAAVRAQMKLGRLVGKSTHSLEQAIAAQKEGADYIGVGPIFATPTKPEYKPVGLELIRQVRERVHVPQFCIGGINAQNLDRVLEAGAERVVMVSALLEGPHPTSYGRQISERLK